jgi:hypothetical protein
VKQEGYIFKMPGSSEPIVKILVDYDYYLRLKKNEDLVKSFDEKKKKKLNLVGEHSEDFPHSSTSAETSVIRPGSDSSEKDPKGERSQLGEGEAGGTSQESTSTRDQFHNKPSASSSSAASSSTREKNYDIQDLVTTVAATVTTAVLKEIESRLPRISSIPRAAAEQIGKGEAEDLLPVVPEEVQLVNNAPMSFSSPQQKSVFHDESDDAKLIHSVPEKYRDRALTLLTSLNKNSLSFDYNTRGEVFIDQISLPNSNIFTIFPALFVRSQIRPPRLSEVATKIAILGLGHLINFGIAKGLKRHKDFIENPLTSVDSKNLKHWYYIGPL